jgi:hypothetical protein
MDEVIKYVKVLPNIKAHISMVRKRELGFIRNWVSMNMMVNF